MKQGSTLSLVFALVLACGAGASLTACSSSGSSKTKSYVHYGAGYRGYYRRPWGYRPSYIGGGDIDDIDPDYGVEPPSPPVAVPLPEMGYPDFGGGFDMDMGGFDW